MQRSLQGIGVTYHLNRFFLYCKDDEHSFHTFPVFVSYDGLSFFHFDDTGCITDAYGKLYSPHIINSLRISRDGSLQRASCVDNDKNTRFFHSHDGIHWKEDSCNKQIKNCSMFVPDYSSADNFVLFEGGTAIKVHTVSSSFRVIHTEKVQLDYQKGAFFTIGDIHTTEEGLYVFIAVTNKQGNKTINEIHVQLYDPVNPVVRKWNEDVVVWVETGEFSDKKATLIGMHYSQGHVYSYWSDADNAIIALTHPFDRVTKKNVSEAPPVLLVDKHPSNPILTPISDHVWESDAVFNAAATYDNDKVHLIYRAVGKGGTSMFGYASSSDGITIDERSAHPIYIPRMPFEGTQSIITHGYQNPYLSGSNSGGCEDPRITKIDGRYYMIYVAFNGWSAPRLAITSIDEQDFINQRWNWDLPQLISRPGIVDKSGSILPEKIQGKYVIFHRVFPHIMIDYVDTLDFDGNHFLQNEYQIAPRRYHWDSRKVGIGATPIKTEDGWLVIYNAVDDLEDSKYKIGAMLLDLEDPRRVIARSSNPILEPTEAYENNGLKYGVVYPCGAVTVRDELIMYYGGSDMVLCAATAPLKPFLKQLKSHGVAHIHPLRQVATQHTILS